MCPYVPSQYPQQHHAGQVTKDLQHPQQQSEGQTQQQHRQQKTTTSTPPRSRKTIRGRLHMDKKAYPLLRLTPLVDPSLVL